MFSGCNSLTSLLLSNFYTKNVYDMQCMFESSRLFFIHISSFERIYIDGRASFWCHLNKNGIIEINKGFDSKYNLSKFWKYFLNTYFYN